MAKANNIFIDTSAFKAIVDHNDDFHHQAVSIWEKLSKSQKLLITSNYILDETFTLLRARCHLNYALRFKEILADSAPVLKIVRVTIDDENKAWNWFKNNWTNLSFTDCVSFAMIKRLGITEVVSFDYHFKRAGFKMFK